MNTTLILWSSLLSFSGFVRAFYGILAESEIDKISYSGISEDIGVFAGKVEKWRAGESFVSKNALPLGLIIAIIAGGVCVFDNPWWSFLIVLIIGYISYLIIAKIIGWYVQILSILTTIISVIMILINII